MNDKTLEDMVKKIYPSIYTRCSISKDNKHQPSVQGRPLSGDTWYECNLCGVKLQREPIDYKEIEDMVSSPADAKTEAITPELEGQTGSPHQSVLQAHPGQIERIICDPWRGRIQPCKI